MIKKYSRIRVITSLCVLSTFASSAMAYNCPTPISVGTAIQTAQQNGDELVKIPTDFGNLIVNVDSIPGPVDPSQMKFAGVDILYEKNGETPAPFEVMCVYYAVNLDGYGVSPTVFPTGPLIYYQGTGGLWKEVGHPAYRQCGDGDAACTFVAHSTK
jgi:hypothetical protein